MPLIRCAKCARAYDVPAPVAVKLPSSVARCECGDLVCSDRAAMLSRFFESGNLEEIDVAPFLVRGETAASAAVDEKSVQEPAESRNIRVIARGADERIDTVFSIGRHPLLIGRRGCHVELDDADLSIRHCEIRNTPSGLVLHDADSHTGTFLDGSQVTDAPIGDGMHLLRVGSALVFVEPSSEPGIPVEPISLATEELFEASPQMMKKLLDRAARSTAQHHRFVLACIEGPLLGKRFDIPASGITIGREGTVRVPDEYLSRKHFAVAFDDEGALRLRDLGSRNGTFLNTLPAKNSRLRAGDEIRAGVNRFRVEEI